MRPVRWEGSPSSGLASLHATNKSRILQIRIPESYGTAGSHIWNLLANILPSFKRCSAVIVASFIIIVVVVVVVAVIVAG